MPVACYMKQTDRCAAQGGTPEKTRESTAETKGVQTGEQHSTHTHDTGAGGTPQPNQSRRRYTLIRIHRCASACAETSQQRVAPINPRLTAAAHTHAHTHCTGLKSLQGPHTNTPVPQWSTQGQLLQGQRRESSHSIGLLTRPAARPQADTQSPCSEQVGVHPAATEAALPTYPCLCPSLPAAPAPGPAALRCPDQEPVHRRHRCWSCPDPAVAEARSHSPQ